MAARRKIEASIKTARARIPSGISECDEFYRLDIRHFEKQLETLDRGLTVDSPGYFIRSLEMATCEVQSPPRGVGEACYLKLCARKGKAAPDNDPDKDKKDPEPAKLTSPAPGTTLNKDATFVWSKGNRVRQYRLLVSAKPEDGASFDFDTGVTTSQSTSPTGLPADTTVFVILLSIGEDGEYLPPPQEYHFRTAKAQTLVAMKIMPSIELQGLSFRIFPLQADNAEGCRQECARNQACQAFTYYRPGFRGAQPLCELKNAAGPAQTSDCCTSGTKVAPAPSLGGGSPPLIAPQPGGGGMTLISPPMQNSGILAGRWVSSDGGPMEMVHQGNIVGGIYRGGPSQPGLSGTITGLFDGTTFRGTFHWQSGSQTGGGDLVFSVTRDGGLEGRWSIADGSSGIWSVKRSTQ